MKKILWVCSDLPFPATHGGRVDMWERIKRVSLSGYVIDLICTVKNDEKINDEILKYVNKISIVKRSNNFLNYISTRPFQVESRKNLKEINLDNKEYDLLMLESEHVYYILENKKIKYKKVAMRIHNNESRYFFNLFKAEKNIIHKAYYLLDSLKINLFRRTISKKVKKFFFISNDELINGGVYDEDGLSKIYHPTPFFVNEHYEKKEKFNILFIGSFFMVNNQEAIIWFLDHIHGRLRKIPNYNLILVGNDKGVKDDFFKKIQSYGQVEVYRSPEDLHCFYNKSMIFINPMQNGAGVKLKTINAVSYGIPIVSTTVGAEGTSLIPSKDFILADDSENFYNALINLYNDENMRFNLSLNAINRLNSNDLISKQINDFLES